MSRLGGPRIVAAVVVLAAVGALVGYQAGLWSHTDPGEDGSATPLVASSPSAPIEPPVKIQPDIDFPVLGRDLVYVESALGSAANDKVTFPVPAGWDETVLNSVEKKWEPPSSPSDSYVLRVKLITSENQPMDGIVDKRERTLESASGLLEFTVLSRTTDTLIFTYVAADTHRLKLSIRRWLEPSGSGEAEVEIAVTGRVSDREGLDRLIDDVEDGLRSE